MFIDDIKCEYYYPMGNKAVVLEKDKRLGNHPVTTEKYETATVDIRMVLFIDALRAKRPTWKFKSTEIVHVAGQKLNTFNVFDGDEDLGRIWVENHWRDGKPRYYFNNPRRQRKQQRGNGGFSSKAEVAAKKLLEEFYSKTIDERAEAAKELVARFTSNIYSRANYEYLTRKSAALKHLEDYVIRHWDELRVHAGASSDVELDKLAAHTKELGSAVDAISQGKGVMLAEEGDSFIYWRKDEQPRKVSLNELSDTQRAKIGMLKLLTEDAVVPGIGARREKTFFVMDGDLT